MICCRYPIITRNSMSNFVSNKDSKHRYIGFTLRNFMRLLRTRYYSFQNKIVYHFKQKHRNSKRNSVFLFCERATKSSVSRGKNDQKLCRLPFAIRTKIIPKESCFRFRQVQLAFSVIRLFLGMNCTMPHLFIMSSVLRD